MPVFLFYRVNLCILRLRMLLLVRYDAGNYAFALLFVAEMTDEYRVWLRQFHAIWELVFFSSKLSSLCFSYISSCLPLQFTFEDWKPSKSWLLVYFINHEFICEINPMHWSIELEGILDKNNAIQTTLSFISSNLDKQDHNVFVCAIVFCHFHTLILLIVKESFQLNSLNC
jgi:hypothetical protein